jgi:copper(I)-binding protein
LALQLVVFAIIEELLLPMRLRTLIEILAALGLTFAALIAISQMAKASGLRVENAFARASIGQARTGAVYLTLVNEAAEADRLRSASVDVASRAEVHLHAMKDDVMTMEDVSCLTIPPRSRISFAPGGLHIMLLDLSSPLQEGRRFPLRLDFEQAGEIIVDVPVKSTTAGSDQARPDQRLEFCN